MTLGNPQYEQRAQWAGVEQQEAAAPAPAPQTLRRVLRVTIAVPDGAAPGTTLRIRLDAARTAQVTVPEGCAPGQTLSFDVPC